MISDGLWRVGQVVENEREVLKILGGPRESGCGIVYVLRDLRNGSVEAAKTFQQLLEEDGADFRARFRSEARIWNRLAGHPNIVEPRGILDFYGLPFMMSDYIEEGDLSILIRSGALTHRVAKICELGMQICDGMTFALQHGVKAHLDIKPTNCLLRNGHLKLCDFGLARTLDGWESHNDAMTFSPNNLSLVRSSAGMVAGTEMYMAPEQIHDPEQVDHLADIFSTGLTARGGTS